jgi:hypothetical protein
MSRQRHNRAHRHIGRRIRKEPLATQQIPPTHQTKDPVGAPGDTTNPTDTSDEGSGRSRRRHNKSQRHFGRRIRKEPPATQQIPPTHRTTDPEGAAGDTAHPTDTSNEGLWMSRRRPPTTPVVIYLPSGKFSQLLLFVTFTLSFCHMFANIKHSPMSNHVGFILVS